MIIREQLEAWLEWCDRDEEDMGGGKYLTPAEVRDMLKTEPTPATEDEQGRYGVLNGWLVEYTREHNCGTNPGGHYGAHEAGCGVERIAKIEEFEMENRFDALRWLAAHDREVAAKALREAANEWSSDDYGPFVRSYLNDRADAIESGEL